MSGAKLMADEMGIESKFVGGSLGTFRQNHISTIAALRSFFLLFSF